MLLEIPSVLADEEIRQLTDGLKGQSFVDGRLTVGDEAAHLKNNLEVKPSKEMEPLARVVITALMRNHTFVRYALPRKLMNPLFNRYDVGMGYGSHTDVSLFDPGRPQFATRTDISLTLFLSDPATYDGGELVISSTAGENRFKPPAGSAVIYPSGDLHWVEEVTRGTRLAAVSWVQSYVKCSQRRGILFELDNATEMRRAKDPRAEELDILVSIYHKLMRLWSET